MKTLIVERDERGITSVVLNRPEKKNAIDYRMFSELREVFLEVSESPTDRVLVLSGAGGNFSAGADLGRDAGTPDRHQLALMRFYGSVARALHHLPQPTIAKIRGVGVGAGLNLALGCDLVAACDTARLSEIFVRRGLSLDMGGSWLLPRLVGLRRAKELALLGDMVSAAEAERIGLVNRAVPDAELDALVDGWAQRLAAGPPLALAMNKSLLERGSAAGMAEALDAEGTAQAVNAASEDSTEGFRAFFQKRDPVFRGR